MLDLLLSFIYIILDNFTIYGPHNIIYFVFMSMMMSDRFILLLTLSKISRIKIVDKFKYIILLTYSIYRFSDIEHYYYNIINTDLIYLIPCIVLPFIFIKKYLVDDYVILEKEIVIIYFLHLYIINNVNDDRIYSLIIQNVIIWFLYQNDNKTTLYYILQTVTFYYVGVIPCLIVALL